MKILLCGDTHGNVKQALYLRRTANELGCDLIIQLGDWGFLWRGRNTSHVWIDYANSALPATPVWFLPGNHEGWDQLEALGDGGIAAISTATWVTLDGEMAERSVQVTYLGRVARFELDGVSFLTVGGAVSVDKHARTPYVTWFPQEEITEADIERACAGGPCDVLLSHEAPGSDALDAFLADSPWNGRKAVGESISNRYRLEAIIAETTPKLLVHGHMHVRYHARHHDTIVEGLDRDGTGRSSWMVFDTEAFRGT